MPAVTARGKKIFFSFSSYYSGGFQPDSAGAKLLFPLAIIR
jgi:hypothetical protein